MTGSRRSGRPLRAAIATRIFAPEPAAAAFRLEALAAALRDRGARVAVLTVRPPKSMRAEPMAGVDERRWPVLRDESGYVRGYLNYLSFDIPLFFRILFGRRYDVVVAEPPPTTGIVVRLACALRRTRYVYYAADVWSDASESLAVSGFVVRALRMVEGFALRGARLVVAVSPSVAERVRELGAGTVAVVRNGIDVATFSTAGDRPDGLPDGPFAIYAGTMSEWQGAGIFAEALRRVRREIPDASVVFVGQGSDWDSVAAIADGSPTGAVVMRGRVAPEEAASWQRTAWLALVSVRPGQGYDLALPTKIMAAAACGTPVLFAGPDGPARDLVMGSELGRAVDYDVDAVAAAMTDALRAEPSREQRDRLAAWAREHASIEETGQRVARLVEQLADG